MAVVLDVGPLEAAEQDQLPDVLRALLHTILLLRSLGTIKLRDNTLASFDLTHVRCCFGAALPNADAARLKAQNDDEALDALVERSITDVLAAAERSARRDLTARSKKNDYAVPLTLASQAAVSFFEMRHRPGWFAAADERVVWEQWRLHISLQQGDAPARSTSLALEKALFQIVRLANERREHLVPVVENKACPVSFPFDITLLAAQEGSLDSLRRLMTARSPMPPML